RSCISACNSSLTSTTSIDHNEFVLRTAVLQIASPVFVTTTIVLSNRIFKGMGLQGSMWNEARRFMGTTMMLTVLTDMPKDQAIIINSIFHLLCGAADFCVQHKERLYNML
ncbi:MAG: hypothetical protein JWO53_717, partial [Chlamydiia bacterium]|nr:hypothetical protein [Chlamydiia bacterium]